MKYGLLLFLFLGVSKTGFGQDLNMVIEVNDKTIISEIMGAYLIFKHKDGTVTKNLVGYRPGKLVLKPEDWEEINNPKTKAITFAFDYYPFTLQPRHKKHFDVIMEKMHFEQPYLVLKAYNLTIRRFRNKYGCLTDASYIYELIYPESVALKPCN